MIKLENISKYYKSESNITLGLSKVNLELSNKEFVAIVGESGCGKSTLLNVISGIDSYEDGELYFNGEETSHYDSTDWENYRRDNISFVFQNYGLIDSYTVYENVMAAMIINNYSEKEANTRVLEIIEQVGLTNHKTHKGTKLSGGQKQRLAIARAIAKESKVLVADEPTGNLDSVTGTEIIALLKEISNDRLVVMVTHNYEEIKDVATRKIRIFDGVIVEDTIIKKTENTDVIYKEKKKSNKINTSIYFSKLNITSQPKRTLFTFIVTLFISILVGLILTGYAYFDNSNTYSDVYNYYFENLNENRVVVKKEDGSFLSDNDYEQLSNLNNISNIFKYDTLLDCSAYIDHSESNILSGRNYSIESVYNVKDITYGTLPNAEDEVVVQMPDYLISEDDFNNPINTEIYIKKNNENLPIKVKVVGIITTKTYESKIFINDNFFADIHFSLSNTYMVQSDNLIFNIGQITKPSEYTNVSNTIYISNSIKDNLNNDLVVNIYNDDIKIDNVNVVYANLDYSSVYFSEDIKEKLYLNKQASVYLNDISKLESVQNELSKLQYDSISPYFVSLTQEDFSLLITKVSMTTLCIILIIIIYILGYIVLKLIFSEKRKDFGILKSIGLDKKSLLSINIIELSIYFLFSFILSVIVIETLGLFLSFIEFFKWYHYLYLLIINLLIGLFISIRFNKSINESSVIKTIKEK